MAGQNCTLSCTVTGVASSNPTITYQWMKNNETHQTLIGNNSDTLSFPSLKLSDAGQYTCQVTVDSEMYGYSEYIRIQSKHNNKPCTFNTPVVIPGFFKAILFFS